MPANARIKAPCALLVFNATNRLLPGAEAVVASAMQEESALGLPHQAGFERGVVGRIAGDRRDASVQADEGRIAYEGCVIDRLKDVGLVELEEGVRGLRRPLTFSPMASVQGFVSGADSTS